MPQELTSTFHSLVKTLRSKSRALGDVDQPRTPRPAREPSGLKKSCQELVESVTQTRQFLLQTRKDYIDQDFIIYRSSKMSDVERQRIDMETSKFFVKCAQLIANLRKEVEKSNYRPHRVEHLTAGLSIVEKYVMDVEKLWSSQKDTRSKRTKNMKVLGSLTCGQTPRELESKGVEIGEGKENQSPEKISLVAHHVDEDARTNGLSVDFDVGEIQALETENTRLYDELNSTAEQVRNIESKVVEISELQKNFAEKLLEQNEEVERINTNMAHATENVKDANEELRQAMQKSAGLRVAVLFCLIVMSFSLLFLDWYNP